jgi:small GTP-binding protein
MRSDTGKITTKLASPTADTYFLYNLSHSCTDTGQRLPVNDRHMTRITTFKFIIVGSSGVGKTTILKRLVEDTFTEDSLATIGVEFDSAVVVVDNRKVKFQIWDTAGQERFRSIAKTYYRNAAGVIVVYDLTDRKSFDELNSWMTDIHALWNANSVVHFIENKADMSHTRVVSVAEAEHFASRHHIKLLETSANIRECFVQVTVAIMGKKTGVVSPARRDTPFITSTPAPKEEGRCC